ncbi:hypothetical protein IKF15_03910 [Candidatus Saccharibacteria bacterium]|nr:hypothetical protein [Candidatus Saccharibacteria bacterium]
MRKKQDFLDYDRPTYDPVYLDDPRVCCDPNSPCYKAFLDFNHYTHFKIYAPNGNIEAHGRLRSWTDLGDMLRIVADDRIYLAPKQLAILERPN